MAGSITVTYKELRGQILNKDFLRGKWGTSWQEVMGSAWDAELVRQVFARRSRWPDWCPSDGLQYIGGERGLERVLLMGAGAGIEDEGLYRGRLRTAWTIWQEAGSQQGDFDALRWTGLTSVSVHRRKDWSMPDDSPLIASAYVRAFQRSVWAQFDVLIDRPHPWQAIFWGSGFRWGDGTTWGSTASVAEIEQLRRLLRRFRSGHDTPTWIAVNLSSGGKVWGNFAWGDGSLWGAGLPTTTVKWLCGEQHWAPRGLR